MANGNRNNGNASAAEFWVVAALLIGGAVAIPVVEVQWVLGVLGALTGIGAMARREEEKERKKLRDGAKTPSGTLGRAAFLTPEQAEAAGLTKPTGLYLGALAGRLIFYAGKGHGLIVAMARAGKGIAGVIPNLLHVQDSIFVTDPKGELAATTGPHRKQNFDQKIVILNPWGLHGLPRHRFNPLAYLAEMAADPVARRGLTEEVAALALQLVPEPNDPKNRFFREGSRKMLRAILLHLATRDAPEACTLTELWRILQNRNRLNEALIEMAGSLALDGVVADLAEDMITASVTGGELFQDFCEGATQAVSIFDPAGWLADCVATSDFNFSELKTGKVSVYLVIPPDRIATHGMWLGLLTRQAITAVARTPGPSKVLFMLDEFANMGRLAGLSEALTLLPGLGVRVWMVVQSLDQLRAVYGQEETATILSQAEVKQFFAVRDQALAKSLSESLGKRTVKTSAINLGRDKDDDPSESWSEQAQPLMSADEIRMMGDDEQLLFIASLPPVRAQRVPFWNVWPWQAWAVANPVEGDHPRPPVTYELAYREKTHA